MPRKIYNKLIRDNIPEIIKQNGATAKISTLNEKDFRAELDKKLLEEAEEILKAETREQYLDELSDVLELIEAVAEVNGIVMKEIEKHKNEKKEKRGSFKKKLFLEYVDE